MSIIFSFTDSLATHKGDKDLGGRKVINKRLDVYIYSKVNFIGHWHGTSKYQKAPNLIGEKAN